MYLLYWIVFEKCTTTSRINGTCAYVIKNNIVHYYLYNILRILEDFFDGCCQTFLGKFLPIDHQSEPLIFHILSISLLICSNWHANHRSAVVHRFLKSKQTAMGDEDLHVSVSCKQFLAHKNKLTI